MPCWAGERGPRINEKYSDPPGGVTGRPFESQSAGLRGFAMSS